MAAHACAFATRAGFTISERLAALILAFRGYTGFAFAAARTVRLAAAVVGVQLAVLDRQRPLVRLVRLAGLRSSVARLPRLLGYVSHRHFTR